MSDDIVQRLCNSLLDYTRAMYKFRTGRTFAISHPPGRESHFITICKALEKVFDGKCKRLIINVAPRSGKTELLISWISWCLAQYPDSNFIYVSYSHTLARKQTQTIRDIISMREYQQLFNIKLHPDSQAKDNFQIDKYLGTVYAAGSGGTITGFGAGQKGLNRFSGAIVIDDIMKPDEATSDVVREGINEWYFNTLQSRLNSPDTPIVCISQRLHEDELVGRLIASGEWETVIIPAIDAAGNSFYPEMWTLANLRKLEAEASYVFHAQYMQNPIPAGGGLFKEHFFPVLDTMPKILATFITADTAETIETYNDASVFSFWGLYKVCIAGQELPDTYALHWLNCWEIRVEPRDLQPQFMDFWRTCMQFPQKPEFCAIEKKSTGVSLISALKDIQGMRVIDIDRPRGNSKTNRFLEIQPYLAQKLITLPADAKHTVPCIKHMTKITANDSHRWDDVCFVKNTKIATKWGNKNIQDIHIGDELLTPFGFGKVTAAGCTGIRPVIKNIGLKGTSDHPIYCNGSFKRLDTVGQSDNISRLTFKELFKWKYLKLLFLIQSNTNLQDRDDIILAGIQTRKSEKVLKDCMLQFMSFIVKKQYKKGMWFIIKTITLITIVSKILSVYHVSNILKCMLKNEKVSHLQKVKEIIYQKLEIKLRFGTLAKMVENGIQKMHSILFVRKEILAVPHAEFPLRQMQLKPSFVQSNVKIYQEEEVFNLTVSLDGVYYANGILVSNCDTAAQAVKMALIDKIVINSSIQTKTDYNAVASAFARKSAKLDSIRNKAYGR